MKPQRQGPGANNTRDSGAHVISSVIVVVIETAKGKELWAKPDD